MPGWADGAPLSFAPEGVIEGLPGRESRAPVSDEALWAVRSICKGWRRGQFSPMDPASRSASTNVLRAFISHFSNLLGVVSQKGPLPPETSTLIPVAYPLCTIGPRSTARDSLFRQDGSGSEGEET